MLFDPPAGSSPLGRNDRPAQVADRLATKDLKRLILF